jgi:nucleotide-binding universal stress UspA family protein
MMKLDRILVYARGATADDPAVSRAFALARHSSARVMLLDVFNELPETFEPLLSSLPVVDAREEAERERRGELARIAETLAHHGIHADFDIRWGQPPIELIQEIVSGRHDLLVTEDDRPRGVHALTHAIIRHCPVPVWMVKNAPHVPPPRVVAAVDPVGVMPGSFDRTVLEIAAGAAAAMDAELYVVHAWQPLHHEFEWLPDGFRRLSEKQDILESTRSRHASAVANLVRSVLPRLQQDRCRLVEGPADRAVLEAVEDIGADLLVLGTARSALYARFLLGKTAEGIVEQTPISILAVKPDGFVTTVSS